MATLQRYQDVERQYRQQFRQRVERQFKIGTFGHRTCNEVLNEYMQ